MNTTLIGSTQTSDNIIVDRKVFLDLIAAAEGARAWMALRAGGDNWSNNTREALNEALPPAIANDGCKKL